MENERNRNDFRFDLTNEQERKVYTETILFLLSTSIEYAQELFPACTDICQCRCVTVMALEKTKAYFSEVERLLKKEDNHIL